MVVLEASFSAFNILCDKHHDHKPWKPLQTDSGLHFPTSEEASYPNLLCERVAHVVKEINRHGSAALQHVNMGFVPRRHKLKPLVSEFSHYHTWRFDVGRDEAEVGKILRTCPKGARIVHRKLLKWGVEVRGGDVESKSFAVRDGYNIHDIIEKMSFGIPRDPDCFCKGTYQGWPSTFS